MFNQFAPGYSYIARIFPYWTRNQDFKGVFCSSVMLTVMLTVLQWATAHSTSLSHATSYLQVQNAKAFAHFPIPPQPPSLRWAGHPSSDIPNRCQQMVLGARPSSCHPLPGTRPTTLLTHTLYGLLWSIPTPETWASPVAWCYTTWEYLKLSLFN